MIELGQVGNYMQSVSVNITVNCDKSLKATFFFAVCIDRSWHLDLYSGISLFYKKTDKD